MNTPTDDYPAFSPYLTVHDAAAIEFYKAAFGATERFRLMNPRDGKIGHAETLQSDMGNYLADIFLNAPKAKVYDALTTERGIQGWWTATSEVGTAVGECITIRFGTTFKVMRIEELNQDARVRWKIIDAHLDVPGLTRTDEWVGTKIVFHLESASNVATRLRIEHIDLTPEVGCFQICSQGWSRFLASLKSYVETATGAPYTVP